MKTFCLLLTGMPNAGKSTIAYELVQKRLRNCMIIDGDKHREMQFLNKKLGFSKEDIMENTAHVVKLAQFAMEQSINVVIAQIAPYRDQRILMSRELHDFFEVFLSCHPRDRETRPNYCDSDLAYEFGAPGLIIPTDSLTIEECVDAILKHIGR